MKYEEFIKKIKMKRELAVKEYYSLRTELLEWKKMTLAILGLLLGLGEITTLVLLVLLRVKPLTIATTYLAYIVIVCITSLTHLVYVERRIERYINVLMEVISENCVTPMGVKSVLRNNIEVLIVTVAIVLSFLIQMFAILGWLP